MEFCENFMPRWKQTRKQISHQVPNWHVFELVYEASARKGLGYFPLSEAKKRNRFFSNLTKLHLNIQPNVFISKFLKFINAAELFRKTYFQIKVKKSGRWKLKSDGHSWKLFAYGKIFAHGKIKSERGSRVKKKIKKNRPKEERKSTILSRKENNSFVEATTTGVAPRRRPDFEQRSHSHRHNQICLT